MKIRVTLKGTRPLLMHNGRLANRLDPHAKGMSKVTAKRTKSDEDIERLSRLEFEGAMYHLDGVGPYIPAENVFASIHRGAKLSKLGRQVERGVQCVGDLELPVIYDGPRDIEGLWGGGESEYVDVRRVRVGTSAVSRTRPIFREWALEAEFLVDPGQLNFDQFVDIAGDAGEYEGIGEYRRVFGRYDVDVEEL